MNWCLAEGLRVVDLGLCVHLFQVRRKVMVAFRSPQQ